MEHSKQFIEKHYDYLLERKNSTTIERRHLGNGLGAYCGIAGFFDAVLLKDDYYLLPFVLMYIYTDIEKVKDTNNKAIRANEFVVNGLKELWDNSKHEDFLAGYVYAFILNNVEHWDESANVLYELAEKNYLPAIATIADHHVSHGEFDQAMILYEDLISIKYYPIWLHYLRLKYRHSGLLGRIKSNLCKFTIFLKYLILAIKTNSRGANMTYLHFYFVSVKFNKVGEFIHE